MNTVNRCDMTFMLIQKQLQTMELGLVRVTASKELWDRGINDHRCAECIRPVCQRKLTSTRWEQGLSEPMNPYSMHDLFMG